MPPTTGPRTFPGSPRRSSPQAALASCHVVYIGMASFCCCMATQLVSKPIATPWEDIPDRLELFCPWTLGAIVAQDYATDK